MTDTIEIGSPPPFKPGEAIELSSVKASKIIGVNVYPGRAEITRVFKFDVYTGQNQVNINGLPSAQVDCDSLRVEGRGAATIHDVTISNVPRTPAETTSPALGALLHKKDRTVKALERCKKSLLSLESYLHTLNVQHIGMSGLRSVMADYDKAAEELDVRGLELEGELKSIDKEIDAERGKLAGNIHDEQLNRRVAIGLFAASAGKVEIALIYGVDRASWSAGYDIRVDMQAKEEQVMLIYRASIIQSTGEDWSDVPLTLQTATPTFGLGVPSLDPWSLSIFKPTPVITRSASYFRSAPESPSLRVAIDEIDTFAEPRSLPMAHRQLEVSGKGNISATFQVPGITSIPNDGGAHNVTITELKLHASMSWVCVPKKDAKVYLKANVKNASECTLLQGTGSVYVNGSFISRCEVPLVSPGESFDCSLSLDPTVRVTYPRVKKVSHSGLYSKTSKHVYSQHITVFNTKTTPAEDVRIIDQVPVSEDERIKVKLVCPALTIGPSGGSEGADKEQEKWRQKVGMAKGVIAQWEGADELETDRNVEASGKNGKISYVCSIPSQGKVNLILQCGSSVR